MPSKTVTTFEALKAAVEDNSTTEITLAADIVFRSGGIRIPKTKGNITVDANGHTVTDYNSVAYTDTMYFRNTAGAGITFTVKNAVWNGKNYYGVICAYDSANNADVTAVLDNVKYTGPQCMYNRTGTTVFSDCEISIERNSSVGGAQELCEGNRVIVRGNVTVNSQTSATSVIWYPYAGSSFSVEEGAAFSVNAPFTYMWYTDTAAKPTITFGKNSVSRFSLKNGLFYAAGNDAHIASSFILETGAEVYFTAAQNNGVPVLKTISLLTVKENATLQITCAANGSSPLIYFAKTAQLVFDKPASVVLYNRGANVFSFGAGTDSNPNALNFTAEMINVWTKATEPYSSAGTFDDLPAYAFAKSGYSAPVTVAVTATASATKSNVNNITDGDKGYPMTADTFPIFKAKVISMGALPLSADKVSDVSLSVTGKTVPYADLRLDGPDGRHTAAAASDGSFILPLSAPYPVDTVLQLSANARFLIKNIVLTTVGSVSITHLPDIAYYGFASPYGRKIVKRLSGDWYVEITDTRKQGGDWYLYVAAPAPLGTDGAQIDGAVTYYGESSAETVTAAPILIKHGADSSPAVTRVSWKDSEGLLLTVEPDALYKAGVYTADLTWEVTETPKQ